jgi:hypothetical protein
VRPRENERHATDDDRAPVRGVPPDEHDTPAEVDATFRTQRRIAVGYFLVFLVVTLSVPLLAVVLDWWSEGQLLGALSPNFVTVAVGLYVFFFLIGLAAASLATAVEERMLGGPDWPDDGNGQGPPA